MAPCDDGVIGAAVCAAVTKVHAYRQVEVNGCAVHYRLHSVQSARNSGAGGHRHRGGGAG